jgi:Tol biopolymer transport system component/predicted Ser/Thr protein kinase
MNPRPWREVEEIFQEALGRDPAERDSYVREACHGDSDLQREVSSLLANHHDADSEPWAVQAAAQLIDAPAALRPGQFLGPYRIESFLAAGGMGEVYCATDTRLNRQVAIKVCTARFSERFAQEAKVIASLNHPHICHLYDVGPNYLVMELVEGTPLQGPIPLKQAVEYAGQILDALDAAHRKGITHRDLKPGNILVTKQGVKLLDFGLAKRSGPLQESDATLTAGLTGKGEIPGTLQYMSPEQLQGKEADARSDLFSFGCVLYEMLVGKRAFEGQSAASVIAAILEREPAPLDAAPPLERVIRTCLEKDPDRRFQTARDLKRNLTWAAEQPIAANAARRIWIPCAAAMLMLGAVGGWAVSRLRQPASDQRVLRLQIEPPPGGRFALGAFNPGGLAISPDGKTAAYVASVNGKTGLWVRPLDLTTARLLPGTEGANSPVWSPDSQSIAFFALGKLQRVRVAGGMPVTISEVPAGVVGSRGAWSDDGYILFSGLSSSPGNPGAGGGLYRAPASGGIPTLLTSVDASRGEIDHLFPQLLPSGRFLFAIPASKPEVVGVYAASIANPAERSRVLGVPRGLYVRGTDGRGSDYLIWSQDRTLVAQEFDVGALKTRRDPSIIEDETGGSAINFSVSETGVLLYGAFGTMSQFKWFDRAGHLVSAVGEPEERNFMFRMSPDARRIVVQRNRPAIGLWLLDTGRGIFSRLSAGAYTHPIWSPDGRTILSVDLGSRGLFRKLASGAGDEQLVIEQPVLALPEDWSGDGQWVMYYTIDPQTKYDLWLLPVTADGQLRKDTTSRPYLRTPFNERFGRFSPGPKPRWVAYQSDRTGQYEIYIDAFPEPRNEVRLSTAGGAFPKWAPDGSELFYVSPDNKLMRVGLKEKGDSIEPSVPQELFTLPAPGTIMAPYDVAADGQRFLVLAGSETPPQPLTVIVNWPALVKKGAPVP